MAGLMSRVIFPWQSMEQVNGGNPSLSGNQGGLLGMPHSNASRRRLVDHKVLTQRLPQSDFFRGDGHELIRFRDHQRLESITIPDEYQSVFSGPQVAKRSIEIIQ